MLKKVFRALLVIGIAHIFLWAFGQLVRKLVSLNPNPDSVHSVVISSGAEDRIQSSSFTGGKVRVLWGAQDIDLRECEVANPPAVLDIRVLFGAAEIHVPTDWSLRVDATVSAGVIEDSRDFSKALDDSNPDLIIIGKVIMGAVEISS